LAKKSYFTKLYLLFLFYVYSSILRQRSELAGLERINFLSIYCSNLDEFYRVRMPALSALEKIKYKKGGTPEGGSLMEEIMTVINGQLEHFGKILHGSILPALASHGINYIYDQPIPAGVKKGADAYFFTQLLAFLQPVHLPQCCDGQCAGASR
jgi:polyphosphate kinase